MTIDTIRIAYLSLLGFGLGSFAGCLSYRLSIGGSVFSPARSYCVKCKKSLRWFDNIPVFSYVALRGRCRYCGMPISPRYLVFELFLGMSAFILAEFNDSFIGWGGGMTVVFLLSVFVGRKI